MTYQVLESACIGCGACDYACPNGALYKTESFLGLFAIDPYRCDHCQDCLPKCPVDAIVPDPEWVVCHGRGCPLSSTRLGLVECNIFSATCPVCRGPLWRRPDAGWACPRCDDGGTAGCPKVRMLAVVPLRAI